MNNADSASTATGHGRLTLSLILTLSTPRGFGKHLAFSCSSLGAFLLLQAATAAALMHCNVREAAVPQSALRP